MTDRSPVVQRSFETDVAVRLLVIDKCKIGQRKIVNILYYLEKSLDFMVKVQTFPVTIINEYGLYKRIKSVQLG